MNQDIKFQIVPFLSEWPNLKTKWSKLYETSKLTSPFYHSLILDTFYNYLKIDSPTHLIIGTSNSEITFGVPIILKEYFGTFYNHAIAFSPKQMAFDHLSPLDSSENSTATKYLFSNLNLILKIHSIQFDNCSDTFHSLLQNIKLTSLFSKKTFRCPFRELPLQEDDFISELKSKKFRANLRQSIKKSENDNIQLIWVNNSNSTLNELEVVHSELIKLHEQRIKSKNKKSQFLTESVQLTHHFFLIQSKQYPGVINFFILQSDTKILGILFGFIMGNTFYFYQSGIHPDYTSISIGNVLIHGTMIELQKKGVSTFDFLRGADAYKFKWTNSTNQNWFTFCSYTLFGNLYLEKTRLHRSIKKYGRIRGTLMRIGNKD